MKLEHKFTVPAPINMVWRALLDPERVAPCFPGASITSASDDEFAGIVKVRLGPISLQYRGSGRFTDTDEAAHRTVIQATGTASGGQGTVMATVAASLVENGAGTAVTVATDMIVTGRSAQFGRGLIEDVGNKIIGQFADCLSRSLGPQEAPAPVAEPPASPPLQAVAQLGPSQLAVPQPAQAAVAPLGPVQADRVLPPPCGRCRRRCLRRSTCSKPPAQPLPNAPCQQSPHLSCWPYSSAGCIGGASEPGVS